MEEIGSPLHVEPILAVNDVSATVQYWQDTLGFQDKWMWGDPPTHGGVSWSGTFIQFSKDESLASSSKGNSIFIRVKKLQSLYRFHEKVNAEIVEPLENKPWGMAGYTVKDINGYYIIFAGALLSDRIEISTELPGNIRILPRSPTIKEYQFLCASVGWTQYSTPDIVEKLLKAPIFAVTAVDEFSQKTVGCALLLGDNASFYYIKDVMVHPEWQSKRIGTAMMKALRHWLDWKAADKALVALIAPEGLAGFYRQFDFAPAFGMVHYVQRSIR